MELQGIKGMWSLRSATDDPYDTFLVVSFISETRVLAMNLEDELEETEIEGFNSQVQTLFCHDAVYNQLVQVCPVLSRSFSESKKYFIHQSTIQVLLQVFNVCHSEQCYCKRIKYET